MFSTGKTTSHDLYSTTFQAPGAENPSQKSVGYPGITLLENVKVNIYPYSDTEQHETKISHTNFKIWSLYEP